MKKSKSRISLIVGISLIFILIAGLILTLVLTHKTPSQPTSIMTCSIDKNYTLPSSSTTAKSIDLEQNPSLQFVLDSKNEVLSVKFDNETTNIVFRTENFIGENAEDAALMFVRVATKNGYINMDLNIEAKVGTKVEINMAATKGKDLTQLQSDIKTSINNFFSENGFIAGAVVNVKSSVKELLNNISFNDSIININLDEKQILEDINKTNEYLKGVAFPFIEETYNEITNLLKTEEYKLIKTFKEKIKAQNDKIQEIITKLEEELTNKEQKLQQELLKKTKDLVKKYERKLEDIEYRFDKKLEKTLKKIKAKSADEYKGMTTELEKRTEEIVQLLKEHDNLWKEKEVEIKMTITFFQENIA